VITIPQIKAARALLGWGQTQVALETGLSPGTIKNIERGAQDPRGSQLAAIEQAFTRAGVVLMEPDDQRGRGAE
jgi:transcriptional regulator with XRE-family HTH domain